MLVFADIVDSKSCIFDIKIKKLILNSTTPKTMSPCVKKGGATEKMI